MMGIKKLIDRIVNEATDKRLGSERKRARSEARGGLYVVTEDPSGGELRVEHEKASDK